MWESAAASQPSWKLWERLPALWARLPQAMHRLWEDEECHCRSYILVLPWEWPDGQHPLHCLPQGKLLSYDEALHLVADQLFFAGLPTNLFRIDNPYALLYRARVQAREELETAIAGGVIVVFARQVGQE